MEETPQPPTTFSKVGDSENNTIEVESLCFNCNENGSTKMLLVDIPFFKKCVVSSFECPHCHYHDQKIMDVEPVADTGVHIELMLASPDDLKRHVIRQTTAAVIIPHLEFESPPDNEANSCISTVEAMLQKFVDRINLSINDFKSQDVTSFDADFKDKLLKLTEFVGKLSALFDNNNNFVPFKIVIHDISGNSVVEDTGLISNKPDTHLTVTRFKRTQEEDVKLGIVLDPAEYPETPKNTETEALTNENEDVYRIPTNCSNCQNQVFFNIHQVNIPYFKEILIFSYLCDACGFKSNEVKGASGIAEKGCRIELKISTSDDLTRDLLKSDFCRLSIPELNIELAPGTLGSSFTTIDGFLSTLKDKLVLLNPFIQGDSTEEEKKQKINQILSKIDEILENKLNATIILDDITGNSYIQNLFAEDEEPDPQLTVTHYERTHEQNEELGLNDMNTENY